MEYGHATARGPLVSLRAAGWQAALVAFLSVGCAPDTPPLDELPLRDALQARPSVVASMPADEREDLAERLLAPQTGEETRPMLDEQGQGAGAILRAADALREQDG